MEYYGITSSQTTVQLPGLPSVYHAQGLTADIAEELWQAGFHDIDVSDKFYHKPLSKRICNFRVDFVGQIEFKGWLVERGAKIFSPMRGPHRHSGPKNDITTLHPERRALHHMAADMAIMVRRTRVARSTHKIVIMEDYRPCLLSERSRQLFTTIFLSSCSDGCSCACSSRGCTASTILQKGLQRLHVTKCLLIFLGPLKDRLIDEIIRFNTFQELQLQHTCCQTEYEESLDDWDVENKGKFRDLELDEIEEIRNENSEGIELLEELMVEFRNKRGDQSLVPFLKGYWTTRMDEVYRTRGKVDLEKAKEMGIAWEPEQVV